jgi:hypothetical protein
MKKLISLAFIFLCLVVSCKKSDKYGIVELPDEVVGVFTGDLAYSSQTNPGGNVSNLAGTVTVTKNGKAVKFTFSDNVPPIENLKFRGNGSSFTSVVDEGGKAAGINIDSHNLGFGININGDEIAFTGIK